MMNNTISMFLFQGAAGGGLGIFLLLPLLFIFATFYFQQRKTKRWQEVLNGVKNGDRVTTSGRNPRAGYRAQGRRRPSARSAGQFAAGSGKSLHYFHQS